MIHRYCASIPSYCTYSLDGEMFSRFYCISASSRKIKSPLFCDCFRVALSNRLIDVSVGPVDVVGAGEVIELDMVEVIVCAVT